MDFKIAIVIRIASVQNPSGAGRHVRGKMTLHVTAVEEMSEEHLIAINDETIYDQGRWPLHFVVQ